LNLETAILIPLAGHTYGVKLTEHQYRVCCKDWLSRGGIWIYWFFFFVWEKQVVMNGDQTCWKEEAGLFRLL